MTSLPRFALLLCCLLLCSLSSVPSALAAGDPAPIADAAPPADSGTATTSDSSASAAADTPVASGAGDTANDSDQQWQTQDWKDNGDTHLVGQQTVLMHKSNRGFRLGLALLLPEWQQVGELLPLANQLNELGFDTLVMLPSAQQLTLDPGSEQDQLAIQAFKEQWQRRISELLDSKGDQPGYTLLLAAGSSAAWLTNLLAAPSLTAPDGLVLVDAFYPSADANAVLAQQVAGLACPVLDLYRQDQVNWLDQAASARARDVRRQNKLSWRQVALRARDERPAVLAGWINTQGWK